MDAETQRGEHYGDLKNVVNERNTRQCYLAPDKTHNSTWVGKFRLRVPDTRPKTKTKTLVLNRVGGTGEKLSGLVRFAMPTRHTGGGLYIWRKEGVLLISVANLNTNYARVRYMNEHN